MLAVRLPDDVEQRIEALSRQTGRTKSFYVREAIVEYLDDIEDYYLAEARQKKIQARHSSRRRRARTWLGGLNSIRAHWPN
jgi:RHH-type rel operon transcriptional repressor/antitoxin RelB